MAGPAGRDLLRWTAQAAGIAASYRTNWPLGFFAGVIAAGFFLLGQGWGTVRGRGPARAQSCPLVQNGRVAPHRAVPHPGTGGGVPAVATARSG